MHTHMLQVDNALDPTGLPVALATAVVAADEGGQGEYDEALHVSVEHNLRWQGLIYLEYVGVVLHTLRLQLEQNLAARIEYQKFIRKSEFVLFSFLFFGAIEFRKDIAARRVQLISDA